MRDPYFADPDVVLYQGNCLEVLRELDEGLVQGVVTSPPYLDQREEYPCPTMHEFEDIFSELGRVCSGPMAWNVGRRWRDGTEHLWWVDLITAATRAGWLHRDTRLWLKPNSNAIKGELFVDSHEYVLVFTPPGGYINVDAIRVDYKPGSIERLRRRHVSHVGVKGDANGASLSSRHDRADARGERHEPNEIGARPPSYMIASVGKEKGLKHPAPMPIEIADELVLMVSGKGATVLDPFAGGGTTLLAARQRERNAIGIELLDEFCELISRRLAQQTLLA